MRTAGELVDALIHAFDRHDLDGIAALYAPGAAIRLPDVPQDVDVDELCAAYSGRFGVVPDVRLRVRRVVADGDLAVGEVVMLGLIQLADVAQSQTSK